MTIFVFIPIIFPNAGSWPRFFLAKNPQVQRQKSMWDRCEVDFGWLVHPESGQILIKTMCCSSLSPFGKHSGTYSASVIHELRRVSDSLTHSAGGCLTCFWIVDFPGVVYFVHELTNKDNSLAGRLYSLGLLLHEGAWLLALVLVFVR